MPGISLATILFCCASAAPSQSATQNAPAALNVALSVDAAHPGPRISPELYGIFFEEVNCAGDGGLYAELVRNRGFEDANEPVHWSVSAAPGAKVELAVDREHPLTAASSRALRLTVSDTGGAPAGVANAGYWGIPFEQNATYDISLYARAAAGFTGPLHVSLEGADGRSGATGEVNGVMPDWRQFRLNLTANATDPAGRLVLSIDRPATIWLDFVSVFPQKTFQSRANGLRPDLAGMLVDLRPAFVRFPGGCWVEGDTLDVALRWKTTLGELTARRTQPNIWQYMATNGLGFHEYLQMCEDLHAEPLFVINCGMSHRENVPLEKMQEWVQDALDAIEYANGAADSQWGALRAQAGHPAPFNLKYLEIGNENGGPAYAERYALFYDALKAKHPEIKLIADEPVRSRPLEIVDEHYYSSPDFFIANAERYDKYERNGPRIYVGEYAVTQGCGTGNLRGALGEAAFMTGMERNADVVVMASYAPLFANVHHKTWNPDLINFDGTRVYGTPSYYVQKLFSENRAEVVLPLEIEYPGGLPIETPHGAIGVGTWNTQAEYKDLRVTQGAQLLFASDFSRDAAGWKTRRGEWKVRVGAFAQTAPGDDCRATAGDPGWNDYTYTLKARKLGGAEGFLVMFHVQDENNWVWWNIGGWGNTRHALEQCAGGSKSILGQDAPGKVEVDRWYEIRVELRGPQIRCYLDNQLIHEVTREPRKPLYAVAGRGGANEIILKVVNVSDRPAATQVAVRGGGDVQPHAAVAVLTGRPEDENTLTEPRRVVATAGSFERAGPEFSYTFPANSLTVLRLHAGAATSP